MNYDEGYAGHTVTHKPNLKETEMNTNFMDKASKIIADIRTSTSTCIDAVDEEVIKEILQDALNEYYYSGYDDGRSEGYADGYEVGRSESHSEGYDYGYSVGYDDGYSVGYDDGYAV